MTILGKFRPGTGSHEPSFQSDTVPPGLARASGVSCANGTATTSVRVSRCPWLNSDTFSASSRKVSKSVRVSHGGSMAALNECTNGCMSVEDRSCFSYQVAAGNTRSENSVVEVIRKSSVASRSSLPSSASSRHTMSRPRCPSGAWSARSDESVPSRCWRKYSSPLADEPSRFERHTVRTLGELPGPSGSSAAKRIDPSLIRPTTCSAADTPASATSSPRSSGLAEKVGKEGIQPSRADIATRSGVLIPAKRFSPVGEARVSAPYASYFHCPVCR